jgi:uncharacterized protein with FMN-binding domain
MPILDGHLLFLNITERLPKPPAYYKIYTQTIVTSHIMKKIWISVGVVAVVAFYAIFASQSKTPIAVQTNPEGATTGAVAMATSSGSTTTSTGAGSSGNTPAGQFKDGTYTGPVTDAIYGKIQVVAVITNSQLSDVQIPVYPNSPGHTTEVSNESLPVLKQEAISIQSGNVNIVSGATQTSEAFQQSLSAALAMAK